LLLWFVLAIAVVSICLVARGKLSNPVPKSRETLEWKPSVFIQDSGVPEPLLCETTSLASLTITSHVFVRKETDNEERAAQLLRDATAKHSDKDFNGAVICLSQAYKLMRDSSIIHPIEAYLRLPLYLQKAGRFEESKQKFDVLLAEVDSRVAREFDHQDSQTRKGLAAMEKRGIYKAMSTAYYRERKSNQGILFALLSHASWCVGLKYQKRDQELSSSRSKTTWQDRVHGVVKDSLTTTKELAVLDSCVAFSKKCTTVAFARLDSELRSLLIDNLVGVTLASIEEDAEPGSSSPKVDHITWLDQATRLHLTTARAAWEAGDFAAARIAYLKTAQAITQIEGADWAKGKLKHEQIEFAKVDPLYRQIVAAVLPLVDQEPGVLQTALYDRLPFSREDVGYVLYFAHELGDVCRRKKGRTYEILRPRASVEPS
jgi:hypothetical protein